jgi:3-oxoacyl-[acyl-carrier-protein] synthase III
MNGAVGFLNACHNGVAMINSGHARKVLVVTAEIDNNAQAGRADPLGLLETGAAAILEENPEDDSGFVAFHFSYFTNHVDAYYSCIGQDHGKTFLTVRRDPQLTDYYLACVPPAVDEFLGQEHVDRRDLKLVFPPQISSAFVTRLGQALALPPDHLVNVANGKDYFTASMVCGLRQARDAGRVQRGDLGLIIGVGTGIQVGCALYRF